MRYPLRLQRPAARLACGLAAGIAAAAMASVPASAQDLVTVDVNVGAARYRLEVPRQSRILLGRTPECARIWHPRSSRLMKFIELCPLAGAARPPRSREARLSADITLNYDVETDAGGGSGGPEAELTGELTVKGSILAVVCHDQSESGPDPEWCLPQLRSLRAVQ